MTIADLLAVLPPPEPPEPPASEGWEGIERTFTSLPLDYREFINIYGACFPANGYLTIFSPFSPDRYLNIVEQSAIVRGIFETLIREFPERYNLDFFPAPGGLLPFGVNIDGVYLLWVATGRPESWTVAVLEPGSGRIQHFPYGMVEWLANILLRRVRCVLFADDLGEALAGDS